MQDGGNFKWYSPKTWFGGGQDREDQDLGGLKGTDPSQVGLSFFPFSTTNLRAQNGGGEGKERISVSASFSTTCLHAQREQGEDQDLVWHKGAFPQDRRLFWMHCGRGCRRGQVTWVFTVRGCIIPVPISTLPSHLPPCPLPFHRSCCYHAFRVLLPVSCADVHLYIFFVHLLTQAVLDFAKRLMGQGMPVAGPTYQEKNDLAKGEECMGKVS